jgi:hypothetical protein
MSNSFTDTAAPEPLAVDARAAAAMLGISPKSLERVAARGEPVGRTKIGRRVVFNVDKLRAWLAAKSAPATN